MDSKELFDTGKLTEAIQALSGQVRQSPLDTKLRTFLFELLCFAGEFDRCEKQLEFLSEGGRNAELGVLLYRAALSAERSRQQFFVDNEYKNQHAPASPVAGALNGRSFQEISDADPRIGARLEIFLGETYAWVPFEHVTSVTIKEPKRLRDLIWTPALIHTTDSFQGRDLCEVLIPVLYPGSWRHSDDGVRLGRVTVWECHEDGTEVPFGQKLFSVDGDEVPILELRNLEMGVAAAAQ